MCGNSTLNAGRTDCLLHFKQTTNLMIRKTVPTITLQSPGYIDLTF